jgi:nitrate/TMAO reductase-like tetraheme cytochrome c subunit
MTVPSEPTVPTEPSTAEADDEIRPVRRFRRVRALFAPFAPVGRVLSKIPHPSLKSRRGIFVLSLLIAGTGAVAGVGGIMAVHYSETASFCGRCHTMDPELKAYAMSPHKEVACAECHIEPGLAGFVKAKANGTKQLAGIIMGKYPTPIPPPDHADLPAVKDTCLKCHSLDNITENGGPVKLVLRPRFRLDATNTRETVAVMLRPAGLGGAAVTPDPMADNAEGAVRGVHWHVEQKVTYTSPDVRSQQIDLVDIKFQNGTTKQYIAGSQVGVSTDVQPDVDRLKASQKTQGMDCISCHNRIGHEVPSPDRVVDEAMASGRISPDLPFIKRDSVALLDGKYASLDAADKAIAGLRTTYAAKYPLVLKTSSGQVTQAINELKAQYRLIATPAMKVQAKTYPDNLGHQTSPGCFRCHDDAHYLVVKGKITNEKIPSTCATCHTFPQVGAKVTSFPLGAAPVTHKDKLYVFSHKDAVSKVDPAGTTCGACHTKSYCENCHKSGAVEVNHDQMLYKHADAIKTAGGAQACGYCHQSVFCAKCHKEPVLQPGALLPAIAGKPVLNPGALPRAIKEGQGP